MSGLRLIAASAAMEDWGKPSTVRSSILPGERPRDLAGAIDEELRRGADHALLQSDKADATGRNPNIDLEGPQSKALATQPHSRNRRNGQELAAGNKHMF